MIRILPQLLLLTILCACTGGSDQSMEAWMSPNGKLKVLSTTAMIDDMVKRIGGDQIDHQVLIRGNLDPHSYQLVKGDDEKLSVASLIFYNGLGLEHGASLQRYLQKENKGIPLGNMIARAHPALILTDNGQTDPHIWMDVSLWSMTVPIIVQELSQHDPAHAELYQKNGDKLLQELHQTDQQIRETLHAIPAAKRYLVTSHDAFNYFARAYLAADDEVTMDQWQKRFAAPEGLAPESQLSATDIKNMMSHLRQYQINVLFPESNVSKDSIKKIVDAGKKEGLTLKIANTSLYADAMGPPGSDGDSYIKMIQHNATTISENLK